MTETSTDLSTVDARRASIVGLLALLAACVGWQVVVAARYRTEQVVASPKAAELAFVEFAQNAIPQPSRFTGDGPQMFVLGNSHTYTLPSPTAGRPMKIGGVGILPDELSRKLGGTASGKQGVYLLAYPNFLPYEMLTRTVQLRSLGYRPRIVVLGLTWRNVARDSRLREQIYACFREPGFAEVWESALTEIDAADAAPIREAVAGEVRRSIRDAEAERMKSHADQIDERLFSEAQAHLPVMRHAVELRTDLYKSIFGFVQRAWQERESSQFSYDLIESDLKFNSHCLRAMLARFVADGSQVVVYYAPERSDLPPLLDPQRQEAFMKSFDAWCAARGITTVDARKTVPNEYWGYDMHTPDRSHFTEPGHRLLAEFLLRTAEPLRRTAAAAGSVAP